MLGKGLDQVLDLCAKQRLKFQEVGTTYDACQHDNPVTLLGRVNGEGEYGTVAVKANETKLIQLPYSTREVQWCCGGSRERSANDVEFDWVSLARAANGAMTFDFLKQV